MNQPAWKVLLIEDSEDDYILTREMLAEVKAGQFEMVWVDRYSLVLESLQTFQPDVALVDYHLGVDNGVDLVRVMREQGYRFPVILLTGMSSYALDVKAMQAGVSDFIDKMQMTGQLLERAIRYAIEQQQNQQRLEQLNEELDARVKERTRALVESNSALAAANAALADANTELRDREALLQQILEILPVGVWITDEKGEIRRGNPASHAIWAGEQGAGAGSEAGSPAGREPKGWWVASGAPIEPHEWAAVRAVTRGETSLNEEIEIECFDGTRKIILNSAIPLLDDQDRVKGSILVNHDITERVRAEEQARRAAARIEAQAEISSRMAEARLDVQATASILARSIAGRIGDACVVTLLSEDGESLQPLAFHHPNPEGLAMLEKLLPGVPVLVGEGLVGQVAQTGKPLLVNALSEQDLGARITEGFRPYIDRFGMFNVILAPMRVEGRVIGTLGVSRDRPGSPYTPEDLLFLEGLADRAALAIDNARLYQRVQNELAERRRVEAELSEIQSRLIDGAEAERLQLARELHDGPIQDLYALSLQLRFLQTQLHQVSDEPLYESLQESLQRVIDALRSTAVELRPPALTRFGLESAIRSYCDQFLKVQPNLRIDTDLESDLGPAGPVLSERVRLALFRILQVALTNVARHAQASQVRIGLRLNEHKVLLEIADNGKGFHVPARWVEMARRGHLGLVGAIERAEALEGEMQVISSPGEGTTIRVIVSRSA